MRSPFFSGFGGAAGSRTVDGPPDGRGTATPLEYAPRTLLLTVLMGEDGASNGIGLMGTEDGKVVIDVEKGAPAPTKPKLEAGAKGASLAPSQCTVPVAITPNH